MTVKEMKEMLDCFPDDMEILHERYSDYEDLEDKHFYVEKGVRKDLWVMRSHSTMSDENKSLEKEYLVIEGN